MNETILERIPITHIHTIDHWCGVHPNKQAFTFLDGNLAVDEQLSFRQLHQKITELSSLFRSWDLQNERVLILLPSGIPYIVSFLACLASNVIAVPFYPPSGKQHWSKLGSILDDCRPKRIIILRDTLSRCEEQLQQLADAHECSIFCYDDVEQQIAIMSQHFSIELESLATENIAFLQYTSGSTGNPKGVMVTNRNLVHNAFWQAKDTGNNVDSVNVSWLPLYHDMGMIGKVLQGISIGAHTVLMAPMSFLRRPINWLRVMSDYQGTVTGGPNFAYDHCVEKVKDSEIETLDLSSWDVAYNGSEPVSTATMDRFYEKFKPAGFKKEAFFPSYGMAESTLYIAGGPSGEAPISLHLDRTNLADGEVVEQIINGADLRHSISCASVYKPFSDQTVRIVDVDTWRTVGERAVAEIWIKSDSIGKGYWGKGAENAEYFQAYTTDRGEGPFFRTGDLGFFDQGNLYVTGRIKEIIIVNGANHYPQDIEETVQSLSDRLRKHCGAAFGMEGEELVIVQAVNGMRDSADELESLMGNIASEVLDTHGISPHYIALVKPGEIDKTSSGKIKRKEIRRRLMAGEISIISEWKPITCNAPLELINSTRKSDTPNGDHSGMASSEDEIRGFMVSWVAEKCKQPIKNIETDIEFASFGLGSIASVELSSALSARYGEEFDATVFFNYPNIFELSKFVSNKIAANKAPRALAK